MSKTLKHILLPAKEEGWELWLLSKERWELVESILNIDESASIPKFTRIAFSTNSVATLPLTIPTADQTTQRGIAQLQMEQSGLVKPSSISWDFFLVDYENTLNTGVSLIDGGIKNDSNLLDQTFDFAARYYEVGDVDTILCKREQGSWVIIFYKESRPFYAEIIDSLVSLPVIMESLLIQFKIQGIDFAPDNLTIEKANHSEYTESDFTDEINIIVGKLDIPTKLIDSINLVIHDGKDLKLVPNSISFARKRKKRNEKLKLYAVICLCVYAIGCMYLFKQYKQRKNQIQLMQNQVAELQPKWATYQENLSKLNELDDLLTNEWPLASFEKVVSHLPGNQELRFQTVEIQSGNFLIKGVSPNINLINALHPALAKDPYFKDYTWRVPVKAEDEKTKLWDFTMKAVKKGGQ